VIFGDLSMDQWAVFLLVLLRSSAVLATMPFFSSPNLPPLLKAGLALSLAVILAPVVKIDPASLPKAPVAVALLCAGEIMIGAILGLVVRMMMTAVQIMGQLMGFQMGFAVANVLDPVTGVQISVLAQFSFLMTMLVLFVVDGHHWFFKALADSFVLVPPGGFGLSRSLFKQVMLYSGEMFSLAIRLGAPVIGALLFTQVVMGLLAKTVPQMNILIVGFPITITVGLIFLSLALGIIIPVMGQKFSSLGPVFVGLMKAM